MKKVYVGIITLVLFALNCNLIFSQEDNFIGNGGPIFGVISLNLDSLNKSISKAGFKEFDKNNGDSSIIVLTGGGGIGGTFKNRFGGYGLNGKITTTNGDKKATLVFSYGGFIYEKGIYKIDATKTDFSLGFLIGGGDISLELEYAPYSNEFDSAILKAHTTFLEKSYFMIAPRINIHQKLAPFIGIDLSAEYLLGLDTFSSSWKTNNDETVSGPFSNIQVPVFSGRISFGF